MKKKVVFLVRDLIFGGAQRQLVTLVKDFDKEKFDVTVLHFYPGPLSQDLVNHGISVISLEKGGRWDFLNFFWRLVKQLKELKPDVLHGYLGESNLLAIFLKPFFPSTRMVWGIRVSQMPDDALDWLGRILFNLQSRLSHWADLIIVNSHAARKDYLTYGFPPQKMVVVPNGIDTKKFQPNQEFGVKVRAELEISDDTILIGLVGRLELQKDHSNFLKAAAILCRNYQNIRFICVGTGPDNNYIQRLHQLTAQLNITDKVIWAGARGDIPAVQNALDIAISASAFGEGFGNTIGEAMACGTPCVVTDVGDSAWIVGDTGIVVKPENPQALAEGISRLIELPDVEKIVLQQKARQKIVDNFSVKQLVETTQSYCLNLLNPTSI
jgi:glycosyltransferase involved in cell wall biosynthesis